MSLLRDLDDKLLVLESHLPFVRASGPIGSVTNQLAARRAQQLQAPQQPKQIDLSAFPQQAIGENTLLNLLEDVALDALSILMTQSGTKSTLSQPNSHTIQADWNYLPEATALAYDTLMMKSPRKSGRYRSGFFVVVDGTYFPPGSNFYSAVLHADREVVIGNVEPYNRKVDVQIANGKNLRFSTPPGEYDAAADAVNRSYNNAVSARRVYDFNNFPARYHQKHRGYRWQTPAIIIAR